MARFPRLASLALALPLLACPSSGDEDGPMARQTGTESASESESESSGATETETETGGGYGHGNLHPDCMGDAPVVVLETTLGDLTLQLDAVQAPITVANFLGYVSSGFYDGTIFHRVIEGFVIQGGGYEPGLALKETVGTIPLEIDPDLRHIDGAIGMARRQEPDTAESQWYICDGAQPGLDDQYAVFGVLIDGFDVRDAIAAVPVGNVDPLTDVPIDDVLVTHAYCVPQ